MINHQRTFKIPKQSLEFSHLQAATHVLLTATHVLLTVDTMDTTRMATTMATTATNAVKTATVPALEVPAVPTPRTRNPSMTQLLRIVLAPPCLILHVLAASLTASHHFRFAFLVLQACTKFLPP